MSLCLEYDARKNPAIWDQLLALTPQKLIDLGTPILAEQQRMMKKAVAQAFPVDLGGAAGAERGWGRCLAVRIGPEMSKLIALRSELGNALATESQRRGLRGMAVVAYGEVRGNGQTLRCNGPCSSFGVSRCTPAWQAVLNCLLAAALAAPAPERCACTYHCPGLLAAGSHG